MRSRPLLSQVVQAQLRKLIVSGEFPMGSQLPNEDRLCERFDVSRVTLREAVRGLVEEGLVVRRHGSGTFVSRRPLLGNSLESNFSYTEYLENAGIRAGKKLLSTKTVGADREVAELLDLDVGSEVLEVRRIRTADKVPAIYSADYLPIDVVDPEVGRTALLGSLYRVLAESGHTIEHGEALLAPVVTDTALAKLLGVTVGTPLQYLRQVDYNVAGRPVMLSHEWHVPSVIELRVYRKGPGVSVDQHR